MRGASLIVGMLAVTVGVGCTKYSPRPQLSIEIPVGFSGNFVLNMGVRGAPALQKSGQGCVVIVPHEGRVDTSTFLENPEVIFQNNSNGRVWGFSRSTFNTGDRISTGGKIEFFVGTQKDFEAEQNKKNKSGGTTEGEFLVAGV